MGKKNHLGGFLAFSFSGVFSEFRSGTDGLRKTGPCYLVSGTTSSRVWPCIDTRLWGVEDDSVGCSRGCVRLDLDVGSYLVY